MSSNDNQKLVHRYTTHIWAERRLDHVADLVADDVVLHAPPKAVGPEQLRERIALLQAAFPDLVQTVEDEVAAGDKVVQRWSIRATHAGEFLGIPATGKEFTISGVSIFRVADGKIVDIWTHSDTLGMMQQIGAIPAPAAA